MGLFGDPFDRNRDGKMDWGERARKAAFLSHLADEFEEDELLTDDEKKLKRAGIDPELFDLDDDYEKRERLLLAGLNPHEFFYMFDDPSFPDYSENEIKVAQAGIDPLDYKFWDDYEKKEGLLDADLDPHDFEEDFDDPDVIDMSEIEEQLHKEGIDVFEFKLMDDKDKLETLEDHLLEPEDFIELFDVEDIDEIRREEDDDDEEEDDDEDDDEDSEENYDDRSDEITDYGNLWYREIIENAGRYTDEDLLYDNIFVKVAESYGVAPSEVARIAGDTDGGMLCMLASIAQLTDEERLTTFTPVERVTHLTGADQEVSKKALEDADGNEAKAVEVLAGTEYKKHITCKMMSEVTEATNVAYLETRRFLLKTNGDVDAAIKMIEDLPVGVRIAITPVKYRKDLT